MPSKTQQQQQKQGGSLVADIQNLAVPFAILLAKQGLESVFSKSKPEKPSSAKKTSKPRKTTPAAAKPKSATRRRTMTGGEDPVMQNAGKSVSGAKMAGGACTSAAACGGLKGGTNSCSRSKQGGNVGAQFNQIANEIKSFMNKYEKY